MLRTNNNLDVVTSISTILDVDITSPTNGDILQYNLSNKWANVPSSSLTSNTIYNNDDSLSGNRTVNQSGNDLTFSNGSNFNVQTTSSISLDSPLVTVDQLATSSNEGLSIDASGNMQTMPFVRELRYTPTYSSFNGISGITLTHDAFGTRIGNTVYFTISCVANVTAVAGFVSFRASVPWNPNNQWGMSNANQAEGSGTLETLGQPGNIIFKADTTSNRYRATWTSIGAGSYLLKLRGSYRIDN